MVFLDVAYRENVLLGIAASNRNVSDISVDTVVELGPIINNKSIPIFY